MGGWPDYALGFYAAQGTILAADYPYISGSTAKDEACLSSNKTKMYPLSSHAYYPVPVWGLKNAIQSQVVDVGFDV